MSKDNKYTPFPPVLGADEIAAFQALERGDADNIQQKKVIHYLITEICGTYNTSYRRGPDGSRDTEFLEGRRAVGLNIVSMLKIPLTAIKETTNDGYKPKRR